MEVNGNAEHHANIPEWGLEDLTGSVLYDAFYESTTMLAGRMLAQQRLAAARGDRDGERRAETDRRGLLAARGTPVVYHKRLGMGKLKLDPALPAGAWRSLTPEELADLGR